MTYNVFGGTLNLAEPNLCSHITHRDMSFVDCAVRLPLSISHSEIQALSERPTGFLQCFDTVGLIIIKIVPEMTYNVLSGTLSLYTATTSHSE